MRPVDTSFEYQLDETLLSVGRGRVDGLGQHLDRFGYEQALLVCGRNVGSNDELLAPIKAALGDRLAAIFDGTTPEKSVKSLYNAMEVAVNEQVDITIGVGGGSSLDIARQLGVFMADGRDMESIQSTAREKGFVKLNPTEPTLPTVAIPTTFAGADISPGGSIEIIDATDSPTGQPIRASGSNWPVLTVHDASLVETTPLSALAGSAMNGFNKPIETLYARTGTPITDATAIHALKLFNDTYPQLNEEQKTTMDRAVVASVLGQFRRQTSVIHAFGHGFSRRYDLQQGDVHAVMAPHVLAYLFSKIDGRRSLIAEGLDLSVEGQDPDAVADSVVDRIHSITDAMAVPTRLREIKPVDRNDFPAIAEFIVGDIPDDHAPVGFEPTAREIQGVLDQAW